MKLYASPRTRGTRVLWTLVEAGADYEYEYVDLYSGAGRRPPYIDLNPAGKVPALVDGDLVLTESAAICYYIAEKYPESQLLPPVGTEARAQTHRWSFFALSELEQPLWTAAKHTFALPEKVRVEGIHDTAAWEYKVALKVLSKGLGDQTWIAGEQFTVADILIGHTLIWGKAFGYEWEQENLTSYYERIRSRPSYNTVREVEKVVNV